MVILSQPGLFRALANSRSLRAKPFQRWLFHDVLPKIMATGSYTVHTREQPACSQPARIPLTREELRAIQASFDNISRYMRHHLSAKVASAIYVPLHARFGIASIKDMSAADLPATLALLETLGKDAHTFYLEQCERESRFLKDMGRKVLPMPNQQELMAA